MTRCFGNTFMSVGFIILLSIELLGCDEMDDINSDKLTAPQPVELRDQVGDVIPLWFGDPSNDDKFQHLDLILVMEYSLIIDLVPQLEQYFDDVEKEGYSAALAPWTGGRVDELRDLLKRARRELGIEGAWLVGDLPAAWYEQQAFDEKEEFPFDIYFMDLDAVWLDKDGDSIFDYHSILQSDIYVSRLQGSSSKIARYFEKIHGYRVRGPSVALTAHIFKYDDWAAFKPGKKWGLDQIYTETDIIEDKALSTRENYLRRLRSGAQYVYQWLHSTPHTLYFTESGEKKLKRKDIGDQNLKGTFYNLFNCSAARFTQANLAMTYLTDTDTGLAIIGSTKKGGIYKPTVFHEQLAGGDNWGEAYLEWYNDEGAEDDEWYLGIVIFGDPLLFPAPQTGNPRTEFRREGDSVTQTEYEKLERIMKTRTEDISLDTFEEYRLKNSSFF